MLCATRESVGSTIASICSTTRVARRFDPAWMPHVAISRRVAGFVGRRQHFGRSPLWSINGRRIPPTSGRGHVFCDRSTQPTWLHATPQTRSRNRRGSTGAVAIESGGTSARLTPQTRAPCTNDSDCSRATQDGRATPDSPGAASVPGLLSETERVCSMPRSVRGSFDIAAIEGVMTRETSPRGMHPTRLRACR